MPPKREPSAPDDPRTLERLVFFSDAVFAIAITLLILDVRLPADGLGNEALAAALVSIWPRYLAYFLSFTVIGLFWLAHVRRFRYLRQTDRRLMFLNLLLLMSIAFVPFPTAVLSGSGNRTATIFYAASMLVVGLLSMSLPLYVSRNARLLVPRAPTGYMRREILRSLVQPVLFALSIPVAFIDSDLAKFFWLLMIPALVLLR